jgi:hypothetical protein
MIKVVRHNEPLDLEKLKKYLKYSQLILESISIHAQHWKCEQLDTKYSSFLICITCKGANKKNHIRYIRSKVMIN